MAKLIILNSREIKKIKQILENQFGHSLQEDYAYLKNEKDRVFVVNKDLAKINIDKLIIERFGLYLGEVKHTQFRLSKEGAMLLYNDAQKHNVKVENVVEISKKEVKKYFQGEDLARDLGDENRFMIILYEQNVIGCAAYKEKTILNFLPKIHRGEVIL